MGCKVIAVSDSKGGVLSKSGMLDVPKLAKLKKEFGSLAAGFSNTEIVDSQKVEVISNEALLELDVDVLVLAALDGVIHAQNADSIKAKHILELANGPVTIAADEILEQKGITVIPDILANAGGVTVSYFEWIQNKSGDVWDLEMVQKKLKLVMNTAFYDLQNILKTHDVSYRQAAFILGMKRIVRAMKFRGWV